MTDRGALVSDILAHPVAELIAGLSGLRFDRLSEAEADDIEMDVMRLESAAEGWPLPKAHDDVASVRAIREHLEAAEEMALALPAYAGCRAIADDIARLRHRLELVARVAATEADRNPRRRGPDRNEAARRVALVAVRVFERRTGEPAKASKHDNRAPANRFSGFVADTFSILGLAAQWYEPARDAVTEIHGDK